MGDTNSGSRFGIGFLLGAALGLALALLFAPKSGKETTKLIKNRLSDIPETVKESTADRKKVYAETWKTHKGRPKVSPTYFE